MCCVVSSEVALSLPVKESPYLYSTVRYVAEAAFLYNSHFALQSDSANPDANSSVCR